MFLDLAVVGPGSHGGRGHRAIQLDRPDNEVWIPSWDNREPWEVCGPHCPVLGTGSLLPQTSAPCGLLMFAGNISKQLYTNSCGELSPTGGATHHIRHHRTQGGLSVCRSLPDPDNVLTATWPCLGPSASPKNSKVPPRP